MIQSAVGVLGSAFAAQAQESGPPRYLVHLGTRIDEEGQHRFERFKHALAQLGWVEGRNLRAEYLSHGTDLDRAQAIVARLGDSRPDVIVASVSFSMAVLQRSVITIPIVFYNITDPVGQGFVGSLTNPGGNATGFAVYEPAIGAKWLETLVEMAPATRKVGVLFNPSTSAQASLFVPTIREAAAQYRIEVEIVNISSAEEIDAAIERLAQVPAAALLEPPDPFSVNNRERILRAAARHRLPAIYTNQAFMDAGGLACYAANLDDLALAAVPYVDRVLRGAKPSELPVQYPTKYDLKINLRTARQLGLTIPQTLLFRADEVIE